MLIVEVSFSLFLLPFSVRRNLVIINRVASTQNHHNYCVDIHRHQLVFPNPAYDAVGIFCKNSENTSVPNGVIQPISNYFPMPHGAFFRDPLALGDEHEDGA